VRGLQQHHKGGHGQHEQGVAQLARPSRRTRQRRRCLEALAWR